MKLPNLHVDKLTTQELSELEQELTILDEQVKKAIRLAKFNHQFAVRNISAIDYMAMDEVRARNLGYHSKAISRLALLMFFSHRLDRGLENPLGQDEPWCTGDYGALRRYADMIVKSNLTRESTRHLIPR